MEIIKVSATSNPRSVAGAISALLREHGQAQVRAIGAGAVNNAAKAIAISRGYVAPNGINLVTVPAFSDVVVNGETKTAINFWVKSEGCLQ
jgi:stage V sporulation protein S